MGRDSIILENVMVSAIYFILLLITLYTPIGLFTLFILSSPFIFFSFRNKNNMLLLIFIIILIVSFLFGSIVAALLTILAASVGYAMGRSYKYKSLLTTILIGISISLINVIIILLLSNILFDVNISNSYNQMLQNSLDSTGYILNQFGEQQSEQIINQYEEFVENASLLLPFVFIVFALLYVFTNHLIASIVINKFGFSIPKFPPFRNWVFPRSIIYYYFVVALIYLLNPNIYSLKVITLNLFPILTIVLLIQGLSFIFYYLYYKKLGKTISIIAIMLIFIPILNQIVQVLGMVDLTFNLRKRLR